MITDADREAALKFHGSGWMTDLDKLAEAFSSHRVASTEALTAENERLEALHRNAVAVCQRATNALQDERDALTARVAELEGALRDLLDCGDRAAIHAARQALGALAALVPWDGGKP